MTTLPNECYVRYGHRPDLDVFDILILKSSSANSVLDTLLDLWETPGVGIGQIRDCLDSLVAERRLAAKAAAQAAAERATAETPAETPVNTPVNTPRLHTKEARRIKQYRRATAREIKVMEAMRAAGMSYRHVARELGFSIATVYHHVKDGNRCRGLPLSSE